MAILGNLPSQSGPSGPGADDPPRTWWCAATTGSRTGWPTSSAACTASRSRSSSRPRSGTYGRRSSCGPPGPRRRCSTGCTAAVNRAAGNGAARRCGTAGGAEPGPHGGVLEAVEPTEAVLAEAGAERAAALALVYDDDETQHPRRAHRPPPQPPAPARPPALQPAVGPAHRGTPRPGSALSAAIDGTGDGAAAVRRRLRRVHHRPVRRRHRRARARRHRVTGTSKVVQTDGLLLRAVERPPPGAGRGRRPGPVHARPALRHEQRPGRRRRLREQRRPGAPAAARRGGGGRRDRARARSCSSRWRTVLRDVDAGRAGAGRGAAVRLAVLAAAAVVAGRDASGA